MKPLTPYFPLRFVLPALLVAIILFINLYTILYSLPNAEKQVEHEIQDYFSETVNRTQGTLRYMFQQANRDAVVREVSNLGGVEGFRLLVLFDENERVVTSNRFAYIGRTLGELATELKMMDQPQLKLALDRQASSRRWSADRQLLVGYYPVPIGLSKSSLRPDRVGLLYVEFDATLRKQRVRSFMLEQSAQISAFTSALLVILLVLLHFGVTRRVMRLVNTAKQVSEGNLGGRAGLEGRDELSGIGAAFDQMVDRLGHEQELLRDSEVKLRAILDNVLDGIITISDRGMVESFNKSAESIFGYTAAEVIGNNVRMLMPEPYHSEHDGYLHNYLSTGKKKIIGIGREVVGRRKDGATFPMDLAVSEMQMAGKRVFIGLVRDISDRKRIEVELAEHLHDLGERVKEQRCLYQLASLSREIALPIEEYFARAVNFLPPAWQYPEYACARIIWNDREYVSSNYASSDWCMTAPIVLGGAELGRVEVSYLKDMPAEHEGHFVIEERELINAFASHVGQAVEMRQSEAALRESEQLVRSIVENVVDGLITIDERGRVESFNKSAESIFGYTAAEVIGNNVRMLMPEPYHSEHDGYLHNYLSTGKKKIIGIGREVVGRRKDGNTFPMDLAVSETQMAGKRVFIGLVRDITERKNAEEAIARISNFNKAIIDGAEHLIIVTDKDGTIQSYNHSAEMRLGYKAEELIGKATPALFHDAEEVVRYAQELRKSGISVEPGFEVFAVRAKQLFGGDTREWTYIRKDGGRFPVLLTVTALRDEQGEINAYLGIATDITERKQNEEELRKLSRAIEQSPVSVLITDAMGNIEYVNTKFTEVSGYAVEESIGKNPRFIQSGLTPAETYQSMWNTLLDGKQWRGKLQNRKKNGQLFWEEMYISAIRDAEGRTTNYVAVKEDITERIKVERMKSEFISTVSHELRTPLTSIRGSLALIAGGVVGELPVAARPLVDIAHKNSERLILLVNDILDIEKIEAGRMEFAATQVTLVPLLKQALEANRAYAEQYKVSYELEGGYAGELSDATICVDANRMLQVLANLLSNAAKFSPPGGRVSVAVERTGKHIRVAVKDNGPGIPEEFRGRIFQKFAQADSSDTRKKGGTGLGLAITRAIVEQMGGSIGFESQPDVQTTFFVDFPECIDKSARQEQALPQSGQVAAAPGQNLPKVLHVEDDADIFHVVKGLAGNIAEMAHAASLAEAKKMLARNRYDLVILDLDLPDGSGKELMPELKNAAPPVPVLIFSSYDAGQEDAVGADAVLVKSRTDNAQLLATIGKLIGNG